MTSSDSNALIDAVREYLDGHPAQCVTERELAAAAEVDVEDLRRELRARLQISPGEFTRRHRFDRVHRDLLQGAPDTLSVATCARRWGFVHLERFTRAYAAQHGEYPGSTLARTTTEPE